MTKITKDPEKLKALRGLAQEFGLAAGVETLLEARAQESPALSLPTFLERAAQDDTQEVLARLGGRHRPAGVTEGGDDSACLSEALKQRLKRLAIGRSCSVAEILEDAVVRYLEEKESRYPGASQSHRTSNES